MIGQLLPSQGEIGRQETPSDKHPPEGNGQLTRRERHMETKIPVTDTLLSAADLLVAAFGPNSKPSIRWLRNITKRRLVPHLRIGRLIRYDLSKVKEALAANCTINAKGQQ